MSDQGDYDEHLLEDLIESVRSMPPRARELIQEAVDQGYRDNPGPQDQCAPPEWLPTTEAEPGILVVEVPEPTHGYYGLPPRLRPTTYNISSEIIEEFAKARAEMAAINKVREQFRCTEGQETMNEQEQLKELGRRAVACMPAASHTIDDACVCAVGPGEWKAPEAAP